MVLSGQRRHFCPPYTSLLFASRPFSFIYFLFPFIYFFFSLCVVGFFLSSFSRFPRFSFCYPPHTEDCHNPFPPPKWTYLFIGTPTAVSAIQRRVTFSFLYWTQHWKREGQKKKRFLSLFCISIWSSRDREGSCSNIVKSPRFVLVTPRLLLFAHYKIYWATFRTRIYLLEIGRTQFH